MSKKYLIVYYSQSGNTKSAAELIQHVVDADLCEIEAQDPYPTNYKELLKRVREEMDKNVDVAYKPVSIDVSSYDVIFVGTPNWGGKVALPLATFLKQQDLTGKTILPFLSHGGVGKQDIEDDLKELCPGAKVGSAYSAFQKVEEDDVEDVIAWMYQYMDRA